MKPIISIQYLRAIAAIMVVIFHHLNVLVDNHQLTGMAHTPVLAAGVDIFFVISGFIMWTIAAARPTRPVDFMRRRIIRIAPLYWAVTIATAMIVTDPNFTISVPPDLGRLLNSLFFIPQWNEKYPELVAPILLVGWTLNLEMLFYVIFALTLFVPERQRLVILCGILFAMGLAGFIFTAPAHPAVKLYANSIVLEFGYGVLLGWLYQSRLHSIIERKNAWPWGGAMVCAGVLLFTAPNAPTIYHGVTWGVPALLIVTGALFLEPLIAKRPIPLFKFLGDASYAIYLTHLMAMALSAKVIGAPFVETAPYATLAMLTAFAVAFGCAAHLWLEKPLTIIANALLTTHPYTIFERFRQKQW